jgi:hypothetical protein
VTTTTVYDRRILDALADHGLQPTADTEPQRLRDAVRDLYKYEIKRLRRDLLAGGIPKHDYANQVIALRKKYPLLSIPTELWTVRDRGGQ